MTEAIFRNWNNSVLSTPRVVAVPTDLQELKELVRDKANYPSPLRVGGSFDSLNACFVTEGTQILLRHFDQVRVDRFGARPLLNQTKQLSRDIVYQTLGEDWDRFLLYRKQNDPDGRFLSKYFEDLIWRLEEWRAA